MVFIGDATFIAGARPDVEALYPPDPGANRAGWGYLMLTNMLPHVTAPSNPSGGGQGPLTLFAFATDVGGITALLGQKAITLDNDHGTKPFGGIDTPSQGGTARFVPNFGWALTPGAAMIPTDGSTITVVVDGVAMGTVDYNHCRAGATNAAGRHVSRRHRDAVPDATNITERQRRDWRVQLATTKLTNGVHTIVWAVTDDQDRAAGIGSRFFTVLRRAESHGERTLGDADAQVVQRVVAAVALRRRRLARHGGRTAWRSVSDADIDGRAGFDFGAPLEAIHADSAGVRHVRMPELGRVELRLGRGTTAGYLNANGTLRPLPAGSQLDTATGVFTWAPGPGFIGTYDLVFLQDATQMAVAVTIEPKPSDAAGQMRGWIDLPTARATVGGTFMVAGWAIDTAAWQGSGVGAVHVWAQRRDVPAASGVFLGVGGLGGARPDVARRSARSSIAAGWSLAASGLAPAPTK